MNAKHQFKYTYSDTDLEEISPVEVTFDMPGEVTITQMLFNFECYLKAAGFYFDGHLEIVNDAFNVMDELDGTLYEFDEEEPKGGCMADFDKECGCESTSSSLEAEQKLQEKLEDQLKAKQGENHELYAMLSHIVDWSPELPYYMKDEYKTLFRNALAAARELLSKCKVKEGK